MIKNLIATVIAFLAGTVITHTYWYQVNLRLQRHHKTELDKMFTDTYAGAYTNGFAHGKRAEQLACILTRSAKD